MSGTGRRRTGEDAASPDGEAHRTGLWYRALIEQSFDAILFMDGNGRIMEWNKASETLTGWSRDEVMERPYWDVLFQMMLPERRTQERYEYIKTLTQETLRTGKGPHVGQLLEGSLVTRSGEIRHIQQMVSVLRTDEGPMIASVARDVTARRQAEQALLRSEALRERVFSSSTVPIVVVDGVTYRFIDCNPAAVQVYRLSSREDVLRKTHLDVSAPVQYDGTPSSEKARSYIKRAVSEGSVVFEWRHQRPDGEVWDAEVHLMSFLVDERQFLQFTLQDVTERKRAEQILRIQHDLILDLNSTTDLNQGLDKVLKSVLQLECIDCGGVYLANPVDNSLDLVAQYGLSAEFVAQVKRFPADSPQVRLLLDGKVHHGRHADITPERDGTREQEGLHAVVVIPIMSQGQLVAVLNLASHSHATIPGNTLSSLETIAYQVGETLQRLRANAALREGEARYRRIFESTLEGIYQTTPNGRYRDANPAFARMLGYDSPKDLIESVSDIGAQVYVDAADREKIKRILASEGVVKGFETRLFRKDRSMIWVLIDACVVRGAQGDIEHYQGGMIDITERKRTEEDIRFRSILLDSALDSIRAVEIDGTVVYANEAAVQATGYSRQELVGRKLGELGPPEGAVRFAERVKTVLEQGHSRFEVTLLRKDGSSYPVEILVRTLEVGEKKLLVAVERDITERKEAEKRERKQLELLMRSEKLASLGTLTAGVAHEINNPNTFISLNAPLAQEMCLDLYRELEQRCHGQASPVVGGMPLEKHRESLLRSWQDIVQGSQRIATIVRELKNYARETPPEHRDDVVLNEVVRSAVTLLRNKLKNATDNLVTEYGEGIPMFRGNNQRLEQVVINLLSNAAEALPDRRNGIQVRTGFDSVGSRIYVRVRDEGAGMSADVLARMRDPFFTTKRNSGGIGLGISISSKIAEEHGGRIEYESQEGRGTTAILYLPAPTASERPPE